MSNVKITNRSLSNILERLNKLNSETKIVRGKLYLLSKNSKTCQRKYLDLNDKKTVITANALGYNINDM